MGGELKTTGGDEEVIDVDVDETQLESPGWPSRGLVPPRAFPALPAFGDNVDGVALVSQSTTVVEGGGDSASTSAILALHHAKWDALTDDSQGRPNEMVTAVHAPPQTNQALHSMNNVIVGDIVNSGQKRPSDGVEQPLQFAEKLLNCVLMSQVVILLEDEAAYEESLKSDLSRVHLHSNGQDTVYFCKTIVWPRAAATDVKGKLCISHSAIPCTL
jgi:hypothetical protein